MIDRMVEQHIDTAVLEAQFRTALDRVKALKYERDLYARRYDSLRRASIALVAAQSLGLLAALCYMVWKAL